MRLPRFIRKPVNGIREYVTLFFDGEADIEDYILVVLLAVYAFILVFHVISP